MAELVAVLGLPHTPLLWRLRDSRDDDLVLVFSAYERMKRRFEAARPDVIVVVASDHLNQYTHEVMPAFSIGKAERIRGIHPNEERSFGLPPVELSGHLEMATAILGHHNLGGSFDFAFTNHPWLDHSFVVPLLQLTPQMDIPVVPIHTNTNAPPLPTAHRFVQLGRYLRSAIEASSITARVVVVASGHLAFELGGPRQFQGSTDPDFDRRAVGWIADGALDEASEDSDFDSLLASGNLSFQYLNFLTVAGLAGRPADVAEGITCRFGSEPFFFWDMT